MTFTETSGVCSRPGKHNFAGPFDYRITCFEKIELMTGLRSVVLAD